jgi:hypothetical protein
MHPTPFATTPTGKIEPVDLLTTYDAAGQQSSIVDLTQFLPAQLELKAADHFAERTIWNNGKIPVAGLNRRRVRSRQPASDHSARWQNQETASPLVALPSAR